MKLPQGFLVSGLHCGIKKKKPDLGLIYAKDLCRVKGVFTTNLNPSYSVTVSKANINKPIKAVLVNSGNANCYSHKQGLRDTKNIVSKLAKFLGVNPDNILIASTGIIGKKLPGKTIVKSFPKLVKKLGDNSKAFAESILTTDTCVKTYQAKLKIGSKIVTISGFAKGAGMIYPNMATMLGFVLADVSLPANILKTTVKEAVDESFNSISIDGCMSTNDTVFFLSSNKVKLRKEKELKQFSNKLKQVCLGLAKLIVKDAEGATKFIEIKIKGAKSDLEAKKAGLALANSSLFKCAIYGENANWGRIVQSLGQAGIKLRENIVVKSSSLKKKNIEIIVDLKRGKSSWSVYTSDLTPAYVKLNAQ